MIFCSSYHPVLSGCPELLPGLGTLPLRLADPGHPVKKVIVLINEDLHYFSSPRNLDIFLIEISLC